MPSFSRFARIGLAGLLLLVLFSLPRSGRADSNEPATPIPTITQTPIPTLPSPTQTPLPSETPYGAPRPTSTQAYPDPYFGTSGDNVDQGWSAQAWFTDLTTLDIVLIFAIVFVLVFFGVFGVIWFYRWTRDTGE